MVVRRARPRQSIGNAGGFIGPYLLGFMHDTLGPDCAADDTPAANQTAVLPHHPPSLVSPPLQFELSATSTAALLGDATCHTNHTHHSDGCVGQYGWATVTLSSFGILCAVVLSRCAWTMLGVGRSRTLPA